MQITRFIDYKNDCHYKSLKTEYLNFLITVGLLQINNF